MSTLERFREHKDEFFRIDPQSPLTPGQKEDFIGLEYFPENPDLDLLVEVEEFEEKEEVHILTNTGEVQPYARYGRFRFAIEGGEAELTIYRSAGGYFLPFTDSQAGDETYGAGRYLDPEELPDGRFRMNFNYAYNPYCAYNPNWLCPITPSENHLNIPIRAGEKTFKDHA
jgi:uncharacterized protein (DUF1684 family)